MIKKHKVALIGFLAIAVVLAIVTSFAVAQSGGGQSSPAPGTPGSRHVDYSVNLQVNGDLSQANPKLQGLLPLNVSATGGADIQKGDNGPAANGDLKVSGLDAVIQNLMAGRSGGTETGGQPALGGLIGNALSDLQFTFVDRELFVKIGGSWYSAKIGNGPRGESGDAPKTEGRSGGRHPDLRSVLPDGPKALLQDVTTTGQEDIDGVSTTHYTASVDIDKTVTDAVAALNGAGKTAAAGKLDAARPQIIAAAKQLDVEWWADGDGRVRQAKIAVEIDPSALATLAGNDAGKHAAILQGITSVKLNATVKFSHFDEAFQIARPEGEVSPLKDLAAMAGFSQDNNRPTGAAHARNGRRSAQSQT